jgi:hypothetical protein
LEEEVLDESSDEEHVEQGQGNITKFSFSNNRVMTLMKRKNLSDKKRQEIHEAVLLRSVNGKLKRRTTTIVANLFSVNRCYVQSIWRTAKGCIAARVPVDVSCKRKKIVVARRLSLICLELQQYI